MFFKFRHKLIPGADLVILDIKVLLVDETLEINYFSSYPKSLPIRAVFSYSPILIHIILPLALETHPFTFGILNWVSFSSN